MDAGKKCSAGLVCAGVTVVVAGVVETAGAVVD